MFFLVNSSTFSDAVAIRLLSELKDMAAIRLSCAWIVATARWNRQLIVISCAERNITRTPAFPKSKNLCIPTLTKRSELLGIVGQSQLRLMALKRRHCQITCKGLETLNLSKCEWISCSNSRKPHSSQSLNRVPSSWLKTRYQYR